MDFVEICSGKFKQRTPESKIPNLKNNSYSLIIHYQTKPFFEPYQPKNTGFIKDG